MPRRSVAAEIAKDKIQFTIVDKSYVEELVDFAVQANITIGGLSACSGQGQGLDGRYSLEEGLTRLLRGANCRFTVVAPGTIQMVAQLAASPPEPVSSKPATTADPAAELSEVVVTSTKRSMPADRLAMAISLIPGEQLLRDGEVDVNDTIGDIAGMSMTNLGPGRDKILLRGLSDGTFTGRTQSTVGTYLDDLPINYNAPDPDLRLADVQAVEVSRGPQGALYGSGSLSGLYRIISRKPDLGNYSGAMTLTDAATQDAASSRSVEAMVNLPLIDQIAALRLVGYGDLDGGYLSNGDLKQSDVDRTGRNGGRAALSLQLDDNWHLGLSETLQRLTSADAQYTSVGTSKLTRANRIRENQSNDFSQTALSVTGEMGWGRLQSSTGYVHHDYASRYDASAAVSLFQDAQSGDLGVYDESTRIDILVEDLVATSNNEGPLQWLAGAFASTSQERTISLLQTRGTSGPPQQRYREVRNDRLTELAPYAELTGYFAERWSVTGGVRYFFTEQTTDSLVYLTATTPSRQLSQAADYPGWAPKISLQYEFEGGDLAYGLLSKGYRAGGFNGGGLSALSAARVHFEPDKLQNIELGAKVKTLVPGVELRSALFCDLWSNIQTDQYLQSGLSYSANVGDARILGWESELIARLTDGLSFHLNTLLDSSRVTRVNPLFVASIRSGLPGVPSDNMAAKLVYETAIDDGVRLGLSGELAYVGQSRLTFDPAQSPPMGGYFNGQIGAQLTVPGWRLLMLLTNPANIAGDTFAFGNPFSFGQVRQVTPLRPRTLSVSVSGYF